MPKQARIPPRKSSASPKKNADYSHSDRGTMQAHGGGRRMAVQSSNTWTSSSGDAFSDHDHLENRTEFLDEFNWLAKKVGCKANLYPSSFLMSLSITFD